MNERIKELMLEAGYAAPELAGRGQKLAELIVKECANIVWDEAEKTSNSDVNDAGYKIIEYFHGVEE